MRKKVAAGAWRQSYNRSSQFCITNTEHCKRAPYIMIYTTGSTVKPWLEHINQQFICLLQSRRLNNTSRNSPPLIPCIY